MPKPQHIFFDLDNTLTPSRRPLIPEHEEIFDQLCAAQDVIVVSGATVVHMGEQVGPHRGRYFCLAQSGNHCAHKDGTELWHEPFTPEQRAQTLAFIEKLKAAFAVKVKDEADCIDDRGAQISYSVVGYHEDPAIKDAFDPDFRKRQAILAKFPDEIKSLEEVGIEVFPAGSSGYNFTPIGKDKGANVARLIEAMNWNRDESLYVGDALGEGQNDHSVVGVIATRSVSGPDDTFAFITSNLL